MLRDVWAKTLWDQRRGLLGWAIGLAGVSLVYGAFYPSVSQPAFAEAMEAFPPALMDAFGWSDLTSAEGYLGSTVFGLLGPVLVIILAIATGARAIAGDEEAGTLELVLAQPIGRIKLVLQRALALAVAMVMAGAVVLVAMLVISGPAELGIPVANLAAAAWQLALLGLTFGSLALAVGGVAGRRSLVLAATAAVAVTAYLGNTVALQVDALAWLQDVSAFHYYAGGEPLRNGLQLGDTAVLLAASAVLVAIAAAAFDRRDVGT